MTIKELRKTISNLPDDAEVIVYADHGQHYEYASDTVVTRDNLENYDDLEEAVFEYAESDIEKEVIENRFYEQQLWAYNSSFCNPFCSYGGLLRFPPPLPVQSYLHTYVACPCCEHKITIW
jgi:hypothetical protein